MGRLDLAPWGHVNITITENGVSQTWGYNIKVGPQNTMSHTAGPNDGVLQREDEDTNSAYENNSDISTVGTFYVTQDRLDDLKEYIRSESTKESNYGALGNSCYDFVDAALGKIGADKSLRDLLAG